MEKRLWSIFKNINDWLQFAEKKNSFIITIVATQLTLIKIFFSDLTAMSYVSLCFLLLSLITAILSFFPKTAIAKFLIFPIPGPKTSLNAGNILFFSDIARHTQDEYVRRLEKIFDSTITGNKYLEDLCQQIFINSKITLAKMQYFKISITLMIFGQLPFFISIF